MRTAQVTLAACLAWTVYAVAAAFEPGIRPGLAVALLVSAGVSALGVALSIDWARTLDRVERTERRVALLCSAQELADEDRKYDR